MYAAQPIACGAFVCTYDGELLTNTSAEGRIREYHAQATHHALLVCVVVGCVLLVCILWYVYLLVLRVCVDGLCIGVYTAIMRHTC